MALVNRLSGRGNRASAILATAVAVAIPLSAIPMASNRSAWWLLWSVVFASLFLVSVVRSGVLRPRRHLAGLSHGPLLLLAALVPLWSLVQILPLTSLLPSGLVAMPPGLEQLSTARISLHPDIVLSGVLRFSGYFFLGVLVVNLATRRDRVLRMATLIYAGVVAQALWALVALNLLNGYALWGETAYRDVATGTFVNRNSLATFLGFGILLGIGLLAERLSTDQIRTTRSSSPLTRLGIAGSLILLGMAFLTLALLQTQSRLGLTATVIGALVMVLLIRASAGASLKRLFYEMVGLGFGLALVLGLVLAGGGVMERFLFVEVEGVHRLSLYSQAWEMIRLRPWTGYGMDAFGPTFEAFRGPKLDTPAHFDLAHNTYLTLWVEFGFIVGSAPMLVILLLSLQMMRRLREGEGYPRLAIVGLGSVVLAGIHSLGDFSLEIPANAYLFVTLICLAIGRRASHGDVLDTNRAPLLGAQSGTLAPDLTPHLALRHANPVAPPLSQALDPKRPHTSVPKSDVNCELDPPPSLVPASVATPTFMSVRTTAASTAPPPEFRSVRPLRSQIGDTE